MATPLTAIPDHLLAEILLRLPAPNDLARASAACVSFRRLVTDRSFIRRFRRFRRLHAPPLLGFLDHEGFNPALPPHPSEPGARAVAHAADFSFNFLPSHCRWTVHDTRDGLVLLGRDPEEHEWPQIYREFAVCDPLHRRFIPLPPVPEDLAALEHPVPRIRWAWCEHLLFPPDEDSREAFRVICVAHCETRLTAFVFYLSTGHWRALASKGWNDLFLGCADSTRMSPMDLKFQRRHYAHGCFYWDSSMIRREELLVLDTRRMEFSIADLPPGVWSTQGLGIVDAGEGRLGMFGFHAQIAPDLGYFIAPNNAKILSQWHMEKKISLDPGYHYSIKDASENYLLLQRIKASSLKESLFEYISMDTKTLQLQRICAKQRWTTTSGIRIYTNFPPSLLSSRAI